MFQNQALKVLSGFSLSVALLAGAANAETLDEALASTYRRNPTIVSQRAYLKSVSEKVTQSQSGYKPTLNGRASYGYRYTRTRTSPLFDEDESKPVTFGVSAVQPVFSGFGTVSAVRSARAAVKAQEETLKNVEQSAMMDAVAAYTGVIRSLAVLKLKQNNEIVLRRQLEYYQDRFRVGELTKTDVAQAKAGHAGAVAARIAAEGDLKIAYADYNRIIGKMPEKLFEPDVPTALLPQSLEDALETALKNNPSYMAAKANADSAKSAVDVAEADYYPSVQVEASYTNSRANAHGSAELVPGAGVVETGRARSDDAAVMLVMDVPLYRAGNSVSKVREAKFVAGQAKFNAVAVHKDVVQATTQAWESYQSTTSSLSSLEEQVRASALALEGVRYEEQAGERTVLDVLNAEQTLLDARVAVVSAKKNLIDASYSLLAAMGQMTPSRLGLDLSETAAVPETTGQNATVSPESETKQPQV